MEIWFEKEEDFTKTQKLLKGLGFAIEIEGKKIIVPMSAFSIRAELLMPYEKHFPKITQTIHDFDIEFPRETGVYKMGGAKITIEHRASDFHDCFQLYQGIGSSLKDLHNLYMAIKAGKALPSINWSVEQTGPSGEDAVKSAENLTKETRKKHKENPEES